eukprot:3845940-Pleurochrysis_carterae.AAC.1
MQKAVVKNMEWANSVPTYIVSRAITTDELDALYQQARALTRPRSREGAPVRRCAAAPVRGCVYVCV